MSRNRTPVKRKTLAKSTNDAYYISRGKIPYMCELLNTVVVLYHLLVMLKTTISFYSLILSSDLESDVFGNSVILASSEEMLPLPKPIWNCLPSSKRSPLFTTNLEKGNDRLEKSKAANGKFL